MSKQGIFSSILQPLLNISPFHALLKARTNMDQANVAESDEEQANDWFSFLKIDGIPALIASATVVGFVSSVLFNFGYVLPWDVSGIWLFTPGDYTSQAVPALLYFILVVLAFALGLFVLASIYILVLSPIFLVVPLLGSLIELIARPFRKGGVGERVDIIFQKNLSLYASFMRSGYLLLPYIYLVPLVAAVFGVRIFISSVPSDQLANAFAVFLLGASVILVPGIIFETFAAGAKEFSSRIINSFGFWLKASVLVGYLSMMPFYGASSFYTKLQEVYLADSIVCAEEDEAIIVYGECFMRSLERGMLFFDKSDFRVRYVVYERPAGVAFNAPRTAPNTWKEVPKVGEIVIWVEKTWLYQKLDEFLG